MANLKQAANSIEVNIYIRAIETAAAVRANELALEREHLVAATIADERLFLDRWVRAFGRLDGGQR
jgi:hypothetical protein